MKKWIALLLAAVLAAGLLTGCQPAFEPTYPEGVTKEKLEEISAKYRSGYELCWYHIEGYGSYYLGYENGYDIFYLLEFPQVSVSDTQAELLEKYTYRIGRVSFYPCRKSQLRAYKDGAFHYIDELYSKREISKDTILAVKEQFDEYMEILKNMGHKVFWQREKRYKKKINDLNLLYPSFNEEYLNGTESEEYRILQKLWQAASEE